MEARYFKYTLNFKKPAGTSRGTMHEKETFFLVIRNGYEIGIGECNLFRGLSVDDRPDYEDKLQWLCDHIGGKPAKLQEELRDYPSIKFGYETAMRSFQSGDPFELFPSIFTQGKEGIPINGLIWMGDRADMQEQVSDKIAQGFDCIKMKVGAISFDEELEVLKFMRDNFRTQRNGHEKIIRVDANGAFSPADAQDKLKALAAYDLHSIEQPIKQGQWEAMQQVCRDSPVPVALDEELIGVHTRDQKQKLLDEIKPQYIILKPALLGGFDAVREWIDLAERHEIGWWVTSALESDIGLNAIAQFTYTLGVSQPQGLGTGSLFTNNIPSPLTIDNAQLKYGDGEWDLDFFREKADD